MRKQLEEIRKQAEEELVKAASAAEIEGLRLKYLGKKGELTSVLRGMGALPHEDRPEIGQIANDVRQFIEDRIMSVKKDISGKETAARLSSETIDVTMPGRRPSLGHRHPLSIVMNEMKEIFLGLGYEIAEGPEIEYAYYNFDALNIPSNHPSRDFQDTFYINSADVNKSNDISSSNSSNCDIDCTGTAILLRTQTSPVQVRLMEKRKPPIKIICPGRVYRSDEVDATHSPVFHQVEGLVVDKGVTMGDLAGTLRLFTAGIFGEQTKIRLRPHNFPFTEPSAEVDVSCWTCGGKGCRVCKGEGWIEILGAGMVHPRVLEVCGIDPEVYSGFAFGIGIDRTAMCKFNIDDMRLLFENDVRFLRQF